MPQNKKILVVDDEVEYQNLIRGCLEQKGYQVITASTAAECLSLISNRRPDLLVLDVHLPDKDGYHVVRQLKKDPVTAAIPIIVISARGKMREIFDPKDIRGFIEKPFELENLLTRIGDVLYPEKRRAVLIGSRWGALQSLQKTLESRRFSLSFFEDPFEAMEQMVAYPPDLMIISTSLRETDIEQYCHTVKRVPATKKTKIVVYDLSSTLKLLPEKAKALEADRIIEYTEHDDFIAQLEAFIKEVF